jgi:glycosyltransferase involved in cell wall biosynthesis
VQDRQGRREGIPVSLMEAMATGLAVVASDISGIPELIRHGVTGILVPPGDAAAIAGAIAGLSASPAQRQRLGAAARAAVLEEFDLGRSSAMLLALIESNRCCSVPVETPPERQAAPSRPRMATAVSRTS